METLTFRPDLSQVMDRWKRVYGATSGALILVDKIKTLNTRQVFPLTQWGFPSERARNAYLDACIEAYEQFWNHRQKIGLHDDLIPSMAPFYGTPEFDGFFPGNVTVGEDTTWHSGYLGNLQEYRKLCYGDTNPWADMVIGGMQYLGDQSRGRYALRQRGYYSPLDLARSMRDSEILTDFYDSPELLHEVLSYCVEATAWWMQQQKETAGHFFGGSLAGFGVWMEGDASGHFSEDTSSQCSPVTYREFGLPYISKIAEKLDGTFIHTHPAGEHNFMNLSEIPNLKVIDIYNDPNRPRGMSLFQKYADTAFRGKIVEIYPSREEILQNLEFLKGVRSILRYEAEDDADAMHITELVKKELPIE